jgi:hypothetical protein
MTSLPPSHDRISSIYLSRTTASAATTKKPIRVVFRSSLSKMDRPDGMGWEVGSRRRNKNRKNENKEHASEGIRRSNDADEDAQGSYRIVAECAHRGNDINLHLHIHVRGK